MPIERVYPKDGPGSLTGGFSVVMLIKDAPHPNAAQLFANWFGSKEAQTIYEAQMMETSLRTDVSGTNLPDYVRPQARRRLSGRRLCLRALYQNSRAGRRDVAERAPTLRRAVFQVRWPN